MDPSNNTFLLSKPKIVRFHNGSIWNLKFTVRFLEACFGGVNPHGTIPRVFSARSQRCIVRTASNLATRRQQVSMPKMEPRLYIVLLQSMSLVYDATLMYKTQWAFDVIMFDAHCTHTGSGSVVSIREHVTNQETLEHGDWGPNRTSAGKPSRPFRRKFATLPGGWLMVREGEQHQQLLSSTNSIL